MSQRFDERAKGIGPSVARRGAMKIFGAGLAAIALASLGLANGDGFLNNPEGDGPATALAKEPWVISDNQGAMKLYCNFRETCS